MIEALLPHRGESLLLRAVSAHDADSIAAVASVPVSSGYASGGQADALLAIEIAAQAAAAHAGLTRGEGRAEARAETAVGFLVGVSELTLRVTAFPCEEELTVSARLESRAQQLATWSFTVAGASVGVIASGRLAVWQEVP